MTTKINASVAGLIESVDTSGILEIQTEGQTAIIIGADQNANFATTGAITVPVGSTAQRPTPVNGMMRYNSNVSVFEVYANNTWSAANVTPAPVNTVAPVISGSAIVGQNLTCTTGTWSGSPTSYFYQWNANASPISGQTANVITLTLVENGANMTCSVIAQNIAGNSSPATSNTLGPVIQGTTAIYLIVAGGGGGGSDGANDGLGGGGGAGGYQTGTTLLTPGTTYTVTIGAGGVGAINAPTNGANSSFGSVSASVGGGAGGYGSVRNGSSGGSGGGGAHGGSTGGSATSGQGNVGGNGASSKSGGGGGAGAAGANAVASTSSGNGGVGLASSISGVAIYYAGGGGGAGSNAGSGGNGGGGAGGSTAGTPGTANTGGGGGGGVSSGGGTGGSGIVIVSYPGAQQFGGGVISTDGSNTIHTFYTSGSLVPITALNSSYLIVAGGGGGGSQEGGGGGAGGLLSGSNVTIDSSSTYAIVVGAGGAGAAFNDTNKGVSGSNSSWSMVSTTAVGGGGGGTGTASGNVGANGGSGGGGSSGGGSGGYTGGSGVSGQGFAGGTATTPGGSYAGAGGGGASQAGFNGTATLCGNGGNGVSSSISGTATYYAGGGGGGGVNGYGATPGVGGLGGGGNGSITTTGSAATANTGGGGGGGGNNSGNYGGGAGGSGVVIVTYPGSTPQMAGGNVTVVSNTVVHTFTSSGYLTPFVNVNNSLRTRSSAGAYLSKTYTTAPTSRTTMTYSAWIKRGTLADQQAIYGTSNNYETALFTSSDTLRFTGPYSSSQQGEYITSQVFRDPSAWYHIVIVYDTTNATAANRMRLFVNGVQVTAFGTQTTSNQNNTTTEWLVSGTISNLAITGGNTINCFDGYMTNVYVIDGQALGPNYFGAFNSYGVWQPIAYAGVYGTNGFYLPFSNTANTTTLCYDFSGNQNNWTPTNISLTAGSTYDAMVDVPTNTSNTAANYCTWNATSTGSYSRSITNFSQGNLLAGGTASGMAVGTMQWGTTGKFYFEQTVTTFGSSTGGYGICNLNYCMNREATIEWLSNGNVNNDGLRVGSFSNTYSQGDILGFAIDVTNGTMDLYKNNTFQTTITTAQLVSSGGFYTNFQDMSPFLRTALNFESTLNCGQRPFAYTPPTGYLALNSYNI